MSITSFTGKHSFLSNFHYSPLAVPGLGVAPSVEHAFQAMKSLNKDDRNLILTAPSPSRAKYRGRSIDLRADWEMVKIPIMRDLITLKFFFDTELSCALLATGNIYLVEGNTWGDTFWGQCNDVGQNWLGKILMDRREELRGLTTTTT